MTLSSEVIREFFQKNAIKGRSNVEAVEFASFALIES